MMRGKIGKRLFLNTNYLVTNFPTHGPQIPHSVTQYFNGFNAWL